jgi:hypothetical protein
MNHSVFIEATSTSPAIDFKADGKLSIQGRSIRLNEMEFYKPLIEWVRMLDVEKVSMDINLEYVDTGCSMLIYQLLKTLDNNSHINSLIVNWHYEEVDFDALEDGIILQESMRKANFRFHEHPETV